MSRSFRKVWCTRRPNAYLSWAGFVQILKRNWNYSLISRVHHFITYWYHRWRITIKIVDFWHVYPGFNAPIGELHALKSLELTLGLSSEFSESLDKIPVRILLDVLFRVVRFSKASDIFIHKILKLRRHLGSKTYGSLPRLICNFTCEITN